MADNDTNEGVLTLEQEGAPASTGEGENDLSQVLEAEGTKAEKHEPPKDSPRWGEVYRKMKEQERMIEGLNTMIKESQTHNRRLAKAIEKGIEKVTDANVKEATDDKVQKLEDELKEMRELRKQALKDVDYDKEEELTSRILDLREQLKEEKAEALRKKAAKDSKGAETSDEGDDAEVIAEWSSKTSWFNEDPLMRAAAQTLDVVLVNDKKWSKKPVALKEQIIEFEMKKVASQPMDPVARSKAIWLGGLKAAQKAKEK
jgi:uncharacterized coiled-coil protein SlyX